MNPKDYDPHPIDTSHVQLPQEIEDLTEKLARNAHEIWARQRKDEGWIWGPEREDEQKTHPAMVPYDDLPESEKDYDRAIAMETIKVILALGFKVTRQ